MRMLIAAAALALTLTTVPVFAQYSSAETQWQMWRSAHPDGGATMAGWVAMEWGRDDEGWAYEIDYLKAWSWSGMVGLRVLVNRGRDGIYEKNVIELSFDCSKGVYMMHLVDGKLATSSGLQTAIENNTYLATLYAAHCG